MAFIPFTHSSASLNHECNGWMELLLDWVLYKLIFYPHCLCGGCVLVGFLQPQSECVAIEALQLCTLLLPPSSRRKLQLLMRMMCRISQNVDMPRLHPAIGTRTLVRLDLGHQKPFIFHWKHLATNRLLGCKRHASLYLIVLFRWCIHSQAASWAVLWSVIWMSCWLPGWFLFYWIIKSVSCQSQSTCSVQ